MDEIVEEARAHRQQRAGAAADARSIVDRALLDLRDKMTEQALSPLLVAMQQRYQETTRVALERLFKKDLAGLGEEDREAVRRWAQVLARRLAHVPLVGMRAIVRDKGLGVAEAFLADADEFLRGELQASLAAAEGGPRLAFGEGDPDLEDEAVRP